MFNILWDTDDDNDEALLSLNTRDVSRKGFSLYPCNVDVPRKTHIHYPCNDMTIVYLKMNELMIVDSTAVPCIDDATLVVTIMAPVLVFHLFSQV